MHALEREQIADIAEISALSDQLDAPVWLRGGWAMDFFLGCVTRDHADVDWFALAEDGAPLATALEERGFRAITIGPADQQIDFVRGRIEHSIALLRLDAEGEAFVTGGPSAGEPWPAGMLKGPLGRIGSVTARLIAPTAQIEIKEMMPIWNPRLVRRQQDLDDIEAIRARLRGG